MSRTGDEDTKSLSESLVTHAAQPTQRSREDEGMPTLGHQSSRSINDHQAHYCGRRIQYTGGSEGELGGAIAPPIPIISSPISPPIKKAK